jgi:L-alanine-DL-glutamate epimerase-like enolase superfamily enzyme
MELKIKRVDWEYASVFRIAYRARTHAQAIQVELREGELLGRAEALGVSYHGETIETLLEQLTSVRSEIRNGAARADLPALLPAGGARNALDCALWDLEAKRSGRRAWEIAGLLEVRPLLTAYTIGLDTPHAMALAARAASQYSLLKLKLNGDCDVERVTAVRAARPDAELIADANQAWSEEQLRRLTPQLAQLGVTLIEQPLPVECDAVLSTFDGPIPLCADEACQTSESLHGLVGKYQFVNIKLDKTGGLTEALHLARLARKCGFKLMMGCMGGSSLAMAPGFVVGQLCDIVDLDGPLLAKSDVAAPIRYEGSTMFLPTPSLWG